MKRIISLIIIVIAITSVFLWNKKEMFVVATNSTFRDGQVIQADLDDGTIKNLKIRRMGNICWYEKL
jgi:hypothetical protein